MLEREGGQKGVSVLYLLEIIQEVSLDLVITNCVFTSRFTVHLRVCPG